jgi:hypothetical protein
VIFPSRVSFDFLGLGGDGISEHRVIGVALGSDAVEGGRIGLVERRITAQALNEVRKKTVPTRSSPVSSLGMARALTCAWTISGGMAFATAGVIVRPGAGQYPTLAMTRPGMTSSLISARAPNTNR